MSEKFTIGDLHFGHRNIFSFCPTRVVLSPTLLAADVPDDQLKDYMHEDKERAANIILEHNETLIDNWNDTVSKRDVVYFMGDMAINKVFYAACVPRLKGQKIMIHGNHDQLSTHVYLQDFSKVLGVHSDHVGKDRIIFTHVPIHPQEFYRWKLNVHGHLHQGVVWKDASCDIDPHMTEEENYKALSDQKREPDLRYANVSCEHTDFRPIHLEEFVKNRLKLLE